MLSPNCLPSGTLLHNRYVTGIALGVGGFGITYKCLDTKVGGICAIKEYFPSNLAIRNAAQATLQPGHSKYVSVADQNVERYNRIMKRFVEEAELVKSLHHRNVITIYDSFFENNTAYYVMEYCDGIDLRRYTKNFTRKLGYDEGMNLLYQIMNGLEYIHAKGILHRDIAPDNIYVTKNNSVKILDFGSARSEMDQLNRELSVIVKVGYAPIEQYGGRGKQGPYTDIYALGATFYHLFTSKIPMESTQRVAEDTLEEFSRLRPDLPDNLKYCIEKSMELTTAKRISSIAEMKSILGLDNASVSGRGAQAMAAQAVPPTPQIQARTAPRISQQPISQQASRMPQQPNPKPNIPPGGNWAKPGMQSAGIAVRMGAYIVDWLIWGVVYYVALFAVLGINVYSIALSSLFPMIFAFINTVSELIASATIGKAMFHLRVSGKAGGAATPGKVILRNIVKLLGIFVIVFAEGNELLQDRATDTVVCITAQ